MEKNITGEKMLSHIDRIAGEKKPITADIFLTNYCNNRCPYCTYGRWELDTGAQARDMRILSHTQKDWQLWAYRDLY